MQHNTKKTWQSEDNIKDTLTSNGQREDKDILNK